LFFERKEKRREEKRRKEKRREDNKNIKIQLTKRKGEKKK
jgi:hypothetical protein